MTPEKITSITVGKSAKALCEDDFLGKMEVLEIILVPIYYYTTPNLSTVCT